MREFVSSSMSTVCGLFAFIAIACFALVAFFRFGFLGPAQSEPHPVTEFGVEMGLGFGFLAALISGISWWIARRSL